MKSFMQASLLKKRPAEQQTETCYEMKNIHTPKHLPTTKRDRAQLSNQHANQNMRRADP